MKLTDYEKLRNQICRDMAKERSTVKNRDFLFGCSDDRYNYIMQGFNMANKAINAAFEKCQKRQKLEGK